jgi:hypothetical protein
MSHDKCKKKTIEKVMKEFENEKLKQRDGKIIIDRKQAIAIALTKTEDECHFSPTDYKNLEIKVINFLNSNPTKIALSRVIETKELIEYYCKKNNIKKCRKYEILLWSFLTKCGMKGLEISSNIWEQVNEIKNKIFSIHN